MNRRSVELKCLRQLVELGQCMFECEICGLLSLGGTSCPACGSQILVDLALSDGDDQHHLNEVPGLDEAVASWKELEGIESDTPEEIEKQVSESKSSTLPFGFSGESNTHVSRLPFGIGSSSQGMPFDQSNEALPLVSRESEPSPVEQTMSPPEPAITVQQEPVSVVEEPVALPPMPTATPTYVEPLQHVPEPMVELPLIVTEPVVESPSFEVPAVRVEAVEVVQPAMPEPVTSSDFEEIPGMWKIDASPIDMEQIYSMEEAVVEVVHSSDDHNEPFNHTSEASDLHPETTIISLDLHPARAMGVNLAGLPELDSTLSAGFDAIGKESWADAAIAFQKMAAKMPGDTAVFNNYGLALLQRALVMAKSADIDVQQLAATQFQSSILALREAAKSAPTNPIVLLNLSHALLVSGRPEKAQNLLQMFAKSNPQTEESINLQAATLVSLGESGQALALLRTQSQDATIRSNLQKLSQS